MTMETEGRDRLLSVGVEREQSYATGALSAPRGLHKSSGYGANPNESCLIAPIFVAF
jgi:hypothetical protein